MLRQVHSVGTISALAIAVALGAQPAAAAVSSNSTVTITVPVAQRLEGTASVTVSSAAPQQQDQMVVKSNISWVVVAHASGGSGGVAWRIVGQTSWQPVGAATPVLQGVKGVHPVQYEVRLNSGTSQGASSILVTFSVEPLGAH